MRRGEDRYNDEEIDRLVAGAYYFRALSHEQWEEFVRARAGYYSLPAERQAAEQSRFVQRLPFVRRLIERDRALADGTLPPLRP